jgi:hypothetical protein
MTVLNLDDNDIRRNLSDKPDLAALVTRIKTELSAMNSAKKEVVSRAIAAGESLVKAKAKLEHGQWLPWLKENFDLSERTAQNYMTLAEGKSKLEEVLKSKSATIADLKSINEALRVISEPEPDTNAGSDAGAGNGAGGSADTSSAGSSNSKPNISDKIDKLVKQLIKKLKAMSKESGEDTAKTAASNAVEALKMARFYEEPSVRRKAA